MPELTEGPGGPAGYARLVERYALKAMPNWHESFVAVGGVRRESIGPNGSVLEIYIPVYWPGDSDFDHLEFALKNDGTNLALLAEIPPEKDQRSVAEAMTPDAFASAALDEAARH